MDAASTAPTSPSPAGDPSFDPRAPDPRLALWRRAFDDVDGERDARLPLVEGRVPGGLRGVLYRNGPGRLAVGGVPYGHPFDGDGMIARFAISSDERGEAVVDYRNRWVRTEEFLAEERAGRMLYRSFGTNLPGGLRRNLLKLHFKNAANTSVHLHGGQLLALWEGGVPHALDPVTLETRGRFDFDGRLRNAGGPLARRISPELPFSAHPRFDGGAMWNFGTLYGPRNHLCLYRSVDGAMAEPERVPLDELAFVHDHQMTASWRIFFLAPAVFDVARALVGLMSPAAAIRSTGKPTTILLVPRAGDPRRTVKLTTRPGFVFHFAGAHEAPDGRLAVDAFRMERYPGVTDTVGLPSLGGDDYPAPVLTRYHLDPARRTVDEEVLCEQPAELPSVHPSPAGGRHRYAWAVGAAPDRRDPFFTALVKLDGETKRAVVRDCNPDLPGEPLFVPAPTSDGTPARDDQGWVLSIVYRSVEAVSELWILDAGDLSTVARLRLPHHLPPGFHTAWVPSA